MNKEKQIEEMTLTEVDILANDINQHCCDLAENYCGGMTCLSCLAHALTDKGYRKASEVAREIFEEIRTLLYLNALQGDVFIGRYFSEELETDIAELKKKYTEDTK